MNDSISVNMSTYSTSSSDSSKSNSLNRSVIHTSANTSTLSSTVNTSSSSSASSSGNSSNGSFRQKRVGDGSGRGYLVLPMTPVRRRSKSQTMFDGDETNTIAEHNKQLIEDIFMLKKQLRDKDETILKLNDIRDKLEEEIRELSASLFEQAYLMVNEAKAEAAQSEKLLREANGKNDVLEAEVKALKELVLTSTPSAPNKHLHPQLSVMNGSNNTQQQSTQPRGGHSRQSSLNQQSFNNLAQNLNNNNSSNNGSNSNLNTLNNNNNNPVSLQVPSASKIMSVTSVGSGLNATTAAVMSQPGNGNGGPRLTHSSTSVQPLSNMSSKQSAQHRRVPSHNDIATGAKTSFIKLFQTSSSSNSLKQRQEELSTIAAPNYTQDVQVVADFDPIYFKELVEWKENPELKMHGSFMERIYKEDVLPCLDFSDKKLSEELLNAIETNSVSIEELTNSQQCAEAMIQVCGLSSMSSFCQYKIKLSESGPWIYISKLTRNKVISVCDFFTYLRYIKDGLVKSDIHETYWKIIDLRRQISLSRLGL